VCPSFHRAKRAVGDGIQLGGADIGRERRVRDVDDWQLDSESVIA
jgi:hypothetical protein